MHPLSYYDTILLSTGSLLLGIMMLIKGGGWAVDSSVYIAQRYKISPMMIGFTIIAFGTSLPELVVSVVANLQGSADITIGNVLGSNTANILMVLGCSALFTPLTATLSKALSRDLGVMIIATLFMAGILYFGNISRLIGGCMIAALILYIFIQYKSAQTSPFEPENQETTIFKNPYLASVMLILGLSCIIIGAEFMVTGAQVSAELMGVPESIIALSIIAFGTSLPELSTSIIAARKGQTEMVIGNVIGSNVFNILMIIGVSSLIKPITQGSFSTQLVQFDVWVALCCALLFTFILFLFGRIGRISGSLFCIAYIVYNIYIYMINTHA